MNPAVEEDSAGHRLPWEEQEDREAYLAQWRFRGRIPSHEKRRSVKFPRSLSLTTESGKEWVDSMQMGPSLLRYSRTRDALIQRRGLAEKFYHAQGPLKVLLVFARDDSTLTALRGAAVQLGYECSLARNSTMCLDSFQSRFHDLVIVDNRDPKTLDGASVGRSLRAIKGSQHSVFVALVKRSELDKQDCSVLPYINAGYDRWVVEMTSVEPFVSELLQMDLSEVQPRKHLWAYQSFMLMAERSRELCIVTDCAHHIMYANRAVERAVGSPAKELKGRYVYDLVHVDSKERLLSTALKGRDWEGVATVAPRRNSETLVLQCRVMPNGAVGRAPANFVFVLEPPPKRGSEAGMSGRGSVPSVRRGSADMRSVCSDGARSRRNFWEKLCAGCLCCRLCLARKRSGHARRLASLKKGAKTTTRASVDSGDSFRRQSVTKLNALSIEAPITKVVTLISQAQELSSPEVSLMLDKVVDILRNTELYSPVVREDRLRPDDPVTSDLISALLQVRPSFQGDEQEILNNIRKSSAPECEEPAGSSMPVPTTRRSSNDSAVTRGVHTSRASRVPNVSSQLSVLLETSLLWEFDIFKLEELSGQRPLVHLGMNLMEHFEVPQTLNVDVNTVHNWLSIIEMNYRATNTYHNSSHAADVMQSSAAFLERDRLQRILDPLDNACCLIAAAVHDVDHPGRSSAFLCNSDHELAILYNDICVLESHHAALAFRLTVSDERVNIFKGLDRDVYKLVRLSIIDMVLATEMTKHFEHLAKFVNVFSKPVREEDESTHNRSRRSLLQLGADAEGAAMTQENIALAKRMLIKCADVSNPARPLRMCVEWALRIAEEYFQQTDEEKDRHLPVVMPMFDRASCSIPKSQIGFMDFIINDMFEAWEVFLNMPQLEHYRICNYTYWKRLQNRGILTVDVPRMIFMIKKCGWYGKFKPLKMSEETMPFFIDLAEKNLFNKAATFRYTRVGNQTRGTKDIHELSERVAKGHRIAFPTKSGNIKKYGPYKRVGGAKARRTRFTLKNQEDLEAKGKEPDRIREKPDTDDNKTVSTNEEEEGREKRVEGIAVKRPGELVSEKTAKKSYAKSPEKGDESDPEGHLAKSKGKRKDKAEHDTSHKVIYTDKNPTAKLDHKSADRTKTLRQKSAEMISNLADDYNVSGGRSRSTEPSKPDRETSKSYTNLVKLDSQSKVPQTKLDSKESIAYRKTDQKYKRKVRSDHTITTGAKIAQRNSDVLSGSWKNASRSDKATHDDNIRTSDRVRHISSKGKKISDRSKHFAGRGKRHRKSKSGKITGRKDAQNIPLYTRPSIPCMTSDHEYINKRCY